MSSGNGKARVTNTVLADRLEGLGKKVDRMLSSIEGIRDELRGDPSAPGYAERLRTLEAWRLDQVKKEERQAKDRDDAGRERRRFLWATLLAVVTGIVSLVVGTIATWRAS